MIKKALTIAGSDSGGGAGIQADLKTFMAFGVFGMSAITALTAQNTLGVQGILEISPDFVRDQIKSVMDDMGTDAVKTGMLSNETIVDVVSQTVKEYGIPNLVVDPVMIAKSGDSLLAETARRAVKEKLIPLAQIITPNTFEAEALTGKKIDSLDTMKEAAEELKKLGCSWVVLKGGHLDIDDQSIDVAYNGHEHHMVKSERFKTKNTHGTGCTFASAIAAGLAKGWPPLKAIQEAKKYISEAIRTSFAVGTGHGPTNHMTGLNTR